MLPDMLIHIAVRLLCRDNFCVVLQLRMSRLGSSTKVLLSVVLSNDWRSRRAAIQRARRHSRDRDADAPRTMSRGRGPARPRGRSAARASTTPRCQRHRGARRVRVLPLEQRARVSPVAPPVGEDACRSLSAPAHMPGRGLERRSGARQVWPRSGRVLFGR